MNNSPITQQQTRIATRTVLNRTTETLGNIEPGGRRTSETTIPLPRDRAVDGRNMRDGAVGQRGAGKLEEALSMAGKGAKLGVKGGKGAGQMLAGTSELSHAGHGLEHAQGIAETGVAAASALKLAVTVGETVLSECRGYAGRQAEKELSGLVAKVGEQGEEGKIASNLVAMNKGREAANAQTRVKAALEGAHSYHAAAHGLASSPSGAAHAAGAATGGILKKLLGPVVQIALGCIGYSKAKKQDAAHTERLKTLGDGLNPENLKLNNAVRDDFKKIHAAAEMAHESRQKHLANAKSDAKINIGMGVVGTALAVVPLVVAAPVVLPIIGIALGVGSIAAVVRSVVHSVGSQRSENKIQGALREAVATKGVMTEEKINSVLEQIKSKNQTRDRARIVAFNGAAAAVSNMIDGLVDKNSISRHGSSLKHLAIKAEVVKLITSDKILKNGTDTHVKQLLNNLNHSNLEATKKEIMGFLAAAAI